MPDAKKVRYEVEIVGHHAPFKWKLYRTAPSPANRTQVYGGGHEGEADTYESALSDATAAAERLHDEWLHANTKQVVPVFEGNPKAPEQMAADEIDRQVAEWASKEFDGLRVVEPQKPAVKPATPNFFNWPPPSPFTREIED